MKGKGNRSLSQGVLWNNEYVEWCVLRSAVLGLDSGPLSTVELILDHKAIVYHFQNSFKINTELFFGIYDSSMNVDTGNTLKKQTQGKPQTRDDK